MRSKSAKSAVVLSIVSAAVAAHAAPTATTPPTTSAAAPIPKVEWTTASLNCDSSSFNIQVKITNTTTKDISGTVTIDGSKDAGVSYSIPAGQFRTTQVKTQSGFANCGAALGNFTGKVVGAAFPTAVTHSFKPHSANYLYEPAQPPSGTKTIFVTKVTGTSTACGQPATFNVYAKNTLAEPTEVKVRVRFGTFDNTSAHKVYVSNEDAFLFPTGVTLDCAAKGALGVRFDLMSGAGASGTVTPRYVIYSA